MKDMRETEKTSACLKEGILRVGLALSEPQQSRELSTICDADLRPRAEFLILSLFRGGGANVPIRENG